MIPDIGFMIGAYIVFRAIESICSIVDGGAHSKLPEVVQGIIVMGAFIAIIAAVVLSVHLYQAGSEAGESLGSIRTMMDSLSP